MKKFRFLTLMAIFIALFTSCEELEEWYQGDENVGSSGHFSNDCYCEASGDMASLSLYGEGEPTIVNFEGDCADATWWDLTGEWAELFPAEECENLGLTLTCENY
ncbi:MAG: hypothetical protein J6V35_08295 [Bacteroidales bacterium]|nr:hypothetical protein [Bacteroidales bacterium]